MESPLHTDLKALAKKYNMKKLILMYESEAPVSKEPANRVLMWSEKKFDEHEFGDFWHNCLHVSQTFRNIIEHKIMHMIEKMIESKSKVEIDELLKKGKFKHAD